MSTVWSNSNTNLHPKVATSVSKLFFKGQEQCTLSPSARKFYFHIIRLTSPVGRMWVQSLGPEDPLGESIETHSKVLAWRIPWTEDPGRLQSIGPQRVRHNWSDLACTDQELVIWQCWTCSYLASIGKYD